MKEKIEEDIEIQAKDAAKEKIAAEMSMEEEPSEGGDLKSKVSGLLMEWSPTTDEGKRYYEDLSECLDGES
tara:strand:- start:823 stop:1035 length:213 start_codon:yes stop_codon:yes gene_type:complete